MVDERTTPEDELEDEPADTPVEEPVEQPAPEDRPDQPAPGVIAQAEYTRATQLNAAIRNKLGVAKGATMAEVLEAMELRLAAANATDDEGEPEEEIDPRIAAAQQRAFEAELRVQKAVYGDEFAKDALDLMNAVRTSDDLEELFNLVAVFRDKHAPAGTPQATPEPVDDEEAGPAGAIDMSEGDRATRTESTPSGRRETGVVSAVRGLLEAAATQRRPR